MAGPLLQESAARVEDSIDESKLGERSKFTATVASQMEHATQLEQRLSSLEQISGKMDQAHGYAAQLEQRLESLEKAKRVSGASGKAGKRGAESDAAVPTGVCETLGRLEGHANTLLDKANYLEERMATIDAPAVNGNGLAPASESKRTEFRATVDHLQQRLVALEASKRVQASDQVSVDSQQVPRAVHEAMLEKMAALKLDRDEVQEAQQGREAQQLQQVASLEANCEELRCQLQLAAKPEEHSALKQRLRELESECVLVADYDTLRQNHEALQQNFLALKEECQGVQRGNKAPQGVPVAEHEALKQQLRDSVSRQEYGALKQQLESRADPQEHESLKQSLQVLRSDYSELCGKIELAEQAHSVKYVSLQHEMQAHTKSHAEVCDENEVLKQRLASVSSPEQQVAMKRELALVTFERDALRERASLAAASHSWTATENRVSREEHEALKEQLKQTVAPETYDALKVKFDSVQLDLVRAAAETQSLKQTFQQRLSEANQAVTEATHLLGSPDRSNYSSPSPFQTGQNGICLGVEHASLALAPLGTPNMLSRNGTPAPSGTLLASGPARTASPSETMRMPSPLSQGRKPVSSREGSIRILVTPTARAQPKPPTPTELKFKDGAHMKGKITTGGANYSRHSQPSASPQVPVAQYAKRVAQASSTSAGPRRASPHSTLRAGEPQAPSTIAPQRSNALTTSTPKSLGKAALAAAQIPTSSPSSQARILRQPGDLQA